MKKRKYLNSDVKNDVYTVETIYKKKIRHNKEPLYFIKWKDWDEKYNSWEPESNILDHSLIETFEDEVKQKIKLRKKNTKCKTKYWGKLDYESDVKSESNKEFGISVDENISHITEPPNEIQDEALPTEDLARPKICIKIQKYKIQTPNSSTIIKSPLSEVINIEKENICRDLNSNDEDKFPPKIYIPISPNKDKESSLPINEVTSQNTLTKKHLKQKFKTKQNYKVDILKEKPKKLLSINEYSAAIKMKNKHHKKSKQNKRVLESKLLQCQKNILNSEKYSTSNFEKKKVVSLCLKKKEKMSKLHSKSLFEKFNLNVQNNKLRFHSQTIVTDVTVNDLCVTVKDMSYEEFIKETSPIHQLVKVPIKSDWSDRYIKRSVEMKYTCDEINESKIMIMGSDHRRESNKLKMIERFEETLIPNLRPSSRPCSVDSYKNIIDKANNVIDINRFEQTFTPAIMTTEDIFKSKNDLFSKSPIKIIIDESEEVDVVGDVDSENSYMNSLQSTRTTVTTQLRQARMSNGSPVNKMIQSLWQSYSYNTSLGMPPLQAAPWVQSYELTTNELHHPYLPRPNSIDPNMLQYLQGIPSTYYPQSTNFTNVYHCHNDERPIDLSFK